MEAPFTLPMLQQHYDVRSLNCWEKKNHCHDKNQAVIEQKLPESSVSLVKAQLLVFFDSKGNSRKVQ